MITYSAPVKFDSDRMLIYLNLELSSVGQQTAIARSQGIYLISNKPFELIRSYIIIFGLKKFAECNELRF